MKSIVGHTFKNIASEIDGSKLELGAMGFSFVAFKNEKNTNR